jgi:hypothetical protein
VATFEHNTDDFTAAGQSEADKSLLVKFFIKPFEDKQATLAEGRPIFKDREYVDIRAPGDRLGGVCRPATLRDIQRFPLHYQKFKARIEGADDKVEGTPLIEWPQITRSQAEELAFFHIKTVEQLAAMAEVHAGKMMNFHTLKRKAVEWLELNKGQAAAIALQEELHKRDMEIEALKSTVAQLLAASDAKPASVQVEAPRDEIAELRAMVEQLARGQVVGAVPVEPAKRKPGRPKVIKE